MAGAGRGAISYSLNRLATVEGVPESGHACPALQGLQPTDHAHPQPVGARAGA